MARTRIAVPGTVGKSIRIPDGKATTGATIGRDLYLPNGQVATGEALRALLGIEDTSGSSSGSGITSLLWRQLREVPANITALAGLTGEGVATRSSGGAWSLVPREPIYLVQEDEERFWTDAEFVRGQNILGVRHAGALVFLPSNLSVEKIVTVKAENGPISVTTYEAA